MHIAIYGMLHLCAVSFLKFCSRGQHKELGATVQLESCDSESTLSLILLPLLLSL